MGSARTIMRGLNSGWPSPLTARDLPKIQALPRQPNDETRDVVLGHEVLHTRRQKQRLTDIPGAKVLAHSPSLNQTRWHLNSDYTDRLLAAQDKDQRFFMTKEGWLREDSRSCANICLEEVTSPAESNTRSTTS